MEKIESHKIRKHPGGLKGWIRWIKYFVIYSTISSGLAIAISLAMMFNTDIHVEVKEITGNKNIIENTGYQLQYLKDSGTLAFKARNLVDWIVFDRIQFPVGFYSLLFYFLISWQLLKIFKHLELDRPFSLQIASRIRWIGVLLILNSIIAILRTWYISNAVNSLTNNQYRFDFQPLLSGNMNDFKTGILVLIIAVVYKHGCRLQFEQDLTI